jgi:hypothetical protein
MGALTECIGILSMSSQLQSICSLTIVLTGFWRRFFHVTPFISLELHFAISICTSQGPIHDFTNRLPSSSALAFFMQLQLTVMMPKVW